MTLEKKTRKHRTSLEYGESVLRVSSEVEEIQGGIAALFNNSLKGVAMLCAVMLCAAAISTPAQAQHRGCGGHHGHHGHHGPRVHFGVGVHLSGPIFSPWFYPPPYAYYPRPIYYPALVVIAPQSPPVYIEREPIAPAPAPAAGAATEESQSWWYYCGKSKTYYPYVRTCPGGWQRVSPTPPPG